MLTASQDIDNFIERQRSQLNKPPTRPSINRQPPPPPQSSIPPNNVQDRLDFKVARILDESPPRMQSQQPYYPPPPPPPPPQPSFSHNSIPEQQEHFYSQQRRLSDGNNDANPVTFFNKFGTYDDKRSQLKDDLKREYNEYLQSKNTIPKSKSTSQLTSTNKRVQFQQQQQQQQQQNGKVIAPWEKNDNKTVKNNQIMNDIPLTLNDNIINRSRPPQISRNYDEQYVRDREDYISELHSQVRELELRKKQLEIESSRLSAGATSNITRAHYNEDLNALNSLLAERLDQRNAVDLELAHILNRPPISTSPTRINPNNRPNINMSNEQYSQQISSQKYQQNNGRHIQSYRNENRTNSNENGFQIGHEIDKESEQATKKRYQQELQAQMRETQMRKAQEKQAKDEYDRKLEEDIQRYNYFGRSGGGAPMRDKDGNVVANLADVRNPPPPSSYQQHQQQQQQQQQYLPPDNKVYSLGDGMSSMGNAPFYIGEQQQQQQYSADSNRPGSPNHTRGAVSNGIFGAAKTDAQLLREEKYKQELKRQIEEKRQREADEIAKRRAEEERELAKHLEWQQQMDKQTADDALRKQEKEEQERLHQQQLQEELERQKKQDEIIMKRKPKRQEKPITPKRDEIHDDDNNNDNIHANGRNNYNDQQSEPIYRSSSPPIPTLKNKDKKQKSTIKNVRRQQSYDDGVQQQSPPPLTPLNNNDEFLQQQPIDDTDDQSRQTYRKPPTPRQPDVSLARKKPSQTYRPRPRANSNSGMPMRTNSTTSLRSDGSDSEVLNRLEHLKRQLKDKEARLQEHVNDHQAELNSTSNRDEYPKTTYQPPMQRKPSPQFLFNAARVHHRDSPTTNDRMRRMIQTDDDIEFKPSYFRDDAILMGGSNENLRKNDNDYYSASKRIDSANQIFATNIEKEANRRRYGHDSPGFYDRDDPTTIANYELNRIAEQNEARLKKLRDLENDDVSLLDSNEVLERFQQRQRMQRGSQTTLQDDAWLK
ncbi:unnamed protein product [Rotaria sordida]|uniref:Centrosome and spindle pole-associated protein 1-like n=1 Tax=Rotaria sordida TaxID=392033 RepID=A0A818TNH3_9BILA|nr:unnamed protein product [Rotaria sordida]CAF1331106.1 unnamed protein product [Rotaria sordida]CAF1591695.1 unnamed protein product [Rotaria sordida]CAF3689258.1 unnamed protein product [Rotaria sordida]